MGKVKEPDEFGDNLYVVRVPKSICEKGEIVLFADSFEITDTGQLLFSYKDRDDDEHFTLCLNANEWKGVYQGNTDWETPLCVKRWHGVAGIRVEEVTQPVESRTVVVNRTVIHENPASSIEMEISDVVDLPPMEEIQNESSAA